MMEALKYLDTYSNLRWSGLKEITCMDCEHWGKGKNGCANAAIVLEVMRTIDDMSLPVLDFTPDPEANANLCPGMWPSAQYLSHVGLVLPRPIQEAPFRVYWFETEEGCLNETDSDHRRPKIGIQHAVSVRGNPLDGTIYAIHGDADPLTALGEARSNRLWILEITDSTEDKYTNEYRQMQRYIEVVDSEPLLDKFAHQCASNVSHFWENSDAVPVPTTEKAEKAEHAITEAKASTDLLRDATILAAKAMLLALDDRTPAWRRARMCADLERDATAQAAGWRAAQKEREGSQNPLLWLSRDDIWRTAATAAWKQTAVRQTKLLNSMLKNVFKSERPKEVL